MEDNPITAPDTDQTAEQAPAPAPAAGSPAGVRIAFGLVRAMIVLALSAVGYQAVVPSSPVVRARLASLVVTRPGVDVFDVKPTAAAEVPSAQTGVSVVETEAKRHPGSTGAYSVDWAPAGSEAAEIIVFLLPTTGEAASTLTQIRTAQLGASSYASNGMARRSTSTVAGLPGSSGALYASTAAATKTATPAPDLAVAAFRFGRTVAVSEVVTAAAAESDADSMAQTEYAHLRSVEPGFSLAEVRRPVEATVLWGIGALLLASLAGFGPALWGWFARRREQRQREERERWVVVGGQAIAKRRR